MAEFVTKNDLLAGKCKPCEGGTPPMSREKAETLVKQLPGWAIVDGRLSRTFKFNNYYETMSFVNATAWISNQEDHHPDLEVGYNRCVIHYMTHAVKGLSENDFICAAKVDRLVNA